jgi:hypothetical protein
MISAQHNGDCTRCSKPLHCTDRFGLCKSCEKVTMILGVGYVPQKTISIGLGDYDSKGRQYPTRTNTRAA